MRDLRIRKIQKIGPKTAQKAQNLGFSDLQKTIRTLLC